MRVTIVLFFLLITDITSVATGWAAQQSQPVKPVPGSGFQYSHGGIIRGDVRQKELALVFTGDSFADGGGHIRTVLKKLEIPAAFFLTGNFYRNPKFKPIITGLIADGHYLGAHSDRHLQYCDWNRRDSLLVTREEFSKDLADNYLEMAKFGIQKTDARYFLPPYEWYNDSISTWCRQAGLILVNFTPGTKSHTDWTVPELGSRYVDSQTIFTSILNFEQAQPNGLNGFILLSHIGADSTRADKFYYQLEPLVQTLLQRGYRFKRINELLY